MGQLKKPDNPAVPDFGATEGGPNHGEYFSYTFRHNLGMIHICFALAFEHVCAKCT